MTQVGLPVFADLALSRRLERAEGYACLQFAAARARIHPESGAAWMELGGAQVVYDGVDSPVTQAFGLGIFEPLTAEYLDEVERFYARLGAPVQLEMSPFAGVEAMDLLCQRGYRPIEISSVLLRRLDGLRSTEADGISVRVVEVEDVWLWTEVNARGWAGDHLAMQDFLLGFSGIMAAREGTVNFLAEIDGVAGAAGALSIHEGVALLAGASTVPEMRRRGLQSALLAARLRYAAEQGCELASIVTLPGSDSQRNAQRNGFGVAYTRMKWMLCSRT